MAKMTKKQDAMMDKKKGIKEGSPADKAMDKKNGVKDGFPAKKGAKKPKKKAKK